MARKCDGTREMPIRLFPHLDVPQFDIFPSRNAAKMFTFIFLRILVWNLAILSNLDGLVCSFVPYDFAKPGEVETAVFTNAHRETETFGQLYFTDSFIEIICQLRYCLNDTRESRSALVKRFASHGMQPCITFSKLTWNSSFEFSELVEDGTDVYWKRNISKTELLKGVLFQELPGAWQFFAELGKGLNLFESVGTLIVRELEPLLSLQFGDSVVDTISVRSPPKRVVIRNSACSPGVAAVVPLLDTNENPYSGCFLGVTYSYFSPPSVKWYNLLHISNGSPDVYSVCKQSTFSSCSRLSILDVAVLNNQMLIVTSQGMVVSQNFTEAMKMGIGQKLIFFPISKVHPTLDQEMKEGSLMESQVRLFYNLHCHSIVFSDHKEELCLVYNPKNPIANGSMLLCSYPPFNKWTDGTPKSSVEERTVLGIVQDILGERVSVVIKDKFKGDTLVEVFHYTPQQSSAPPFHIDHSENVTSMYLHPYTHALYAYGSQVWQSLDGGNSFHKVTALRTTDSVTSFSTDVCGETFSLTTKLGIVYIGKMGMHRVTAIKNFGNVSGTFANGSVNDPVVSMVVEHDKSVITVNFQANNGKLFLHHNILKIADGAEIHTLFDSSLMVRFLAENKAEFLPLCQSAFSDCGKLFSTFHIGRVIHSKYGGSATITRIKRYANLDTSMFGECAVAEIVNPFREFQTDLTDVPLEVTWYGFNATLTLKNDSAQWLRADIGKTVVLPSGLSFILLDHRNYSTVIAMSYFPWSREVAFGGTFKGWTLYDFRSPYLGNSSWWVTEDTCRSVLIPSEPSIMRFFHLDSKDNLSITASVVSRMSVGEPSSRRSPKLLIASPRLFLVRSHHTHSHLNSSLHVFISQRPLATGTSSLTVFLEESSLFCRRSSFTVVVHSGCPPSKKLRFLYPLSFSEDTFLNSSAIDVKGIVRNVKLPFNYRPPSSRGKAIPMAANVYNANPKKPQYKDSYAVTRKTLRYKQCQGKKERSACGCTRSIRMSSLVKYSDCIDTVYRLLFAERLTPRFLVLRNGREPEALKSPYFLEELNQRSDFEIINPSNISLSRGPFPIMEQDQNSSIEFRGSGLYHFRAFAVRENYTFCNLTDEFIVFVNETPLPYPTKDVVRACTAMGFFAVMYLLYLWNFHGTKGINE